MENIKTHRMVQNAIYVCLMVICYFTGTIWFVLVTTGKITIGGMVSAFTVCVLPFVVPDAIKLLGAITISKRLKLH